MVVSYYKGLVAWYEPLLSWNEFFVTLAKLCGFCIGICSITLVFEHLLLGFFLEGSKSFTLNIFFC